MTHENSGNSTNLYESENNEVSRTVLAALDEMSEVVRELENGSLTREQQIDMNSLSASLGVLRASEMHMRQTAENGYEIIAKTNNGKFQVLITSITQGSTGDHTIQNLYLNYEHSKESDIFTNSFDININNEEIQFTRTRIDNQLIEGGTFTRDYTFER